MKIRTFIARDMRQALRQIREEQGPDAVILSSRSCPDGVEVSSAVDFEISQLSALEPVSETSTLHADWHVPSDSALVAELQYMRRIVETQRAQLGWNDIARLSPVRAELLKVLAEIGIARDLASELVAEVPTDLSFAEGRRRALLLLAQRLEVTGDALLDQGGRMAFVGPTGVGKTTSIAKLAARWVLRHGTRDIALVSIDSRGFGSREQLTVLGRLLGVESFVVDSFAQLPGLLEQLSDRRLVLVDTAGMSPRDPNLPILAAQFCANAALAQLRCCLVLSAASQAGVLVEAYRGFNDFGPACCLLTRLDESTSFGGTLSLLASTRLPASYISDGQQIPDNLVPARAPQLVVRAVKLAREGGAVAAEDLLMRNFGAMSHAIA